MGLQSQAWLNGLGDEWLERNRSQLGHGDDLVIDFIVDNKLPVGKVYEIGCSNGWRLKILQDLGWDVWGVDPSEKAVREAGTILGTQSRVSLGTADHAIAIAQNSDVVILGFCMCLVDPLDWPKVVGEVDKCLRTGGYLLIHDQAMDAPSVDIERYDVKFDVDADKYTEFPMYITHWPKLWSSFPSYKLIAEAKVPGRKDICFAFKKDEYWHVDTL